MSTKGVPWRVPDKGMPVSRSHRAPAQTIRERKALDQWKRLPDGPLDYVSLERKTLRTEYTGGYLLGWLHCLIVLGFLGFIWLWVSVGGS